jgi:hypothetical protein
MQAGLHEQYGGVKPDVARDAHARAIQVRCNSLTIGLLFIRVYILSHLTISKTFISHAPEILLGAQEQ